MEFSCHTTDYKKTFEFGSGCRLSPAHTECPSKYVTDMTPSQGYPACTFDGSAQYRLSTELPGFPPCSSEPLMAGHRMKGLVQLQRFPLAGLASSDVLLVEELSKESEEGQHVEEQQLDEEHVVPRVHNPQIQCLHATTRGLSMMFALHATTQESAWCALCIHDRCRKFIAEPPYSRRCS